MNPALSKTLPQPTIIKFTNFYDPSQSLMTYFQQSILILDSFSAKTDFDKANLFNCYFHSVFHNPSDLPVINELPDIAISLRTINISC